MRSRTAGSGTDSATETRRLFSREIEYAAARGARQTDKNEPSETPLILPGPAPGGKFRCVQGGGSVRCARQRSKSGIPVGDRKEREGFTQGPLLMLKARFEKTDAW